LGQRCHSKPKKTVSLRQTVGGAITSVSLVGGGREELRGAW